jgi:hypothetical protein
LDAVSCSVVRLLVGVVSRIEAPRIRAENRLGQCMI